MRKLNIIATCGALTAILAGAVAVMPVHAGDAPGRGRILFLRCASCHDVSAAQSAKIGPSLSGVLGRKVASLPGYAYSQALRSQDFVWDAPHLDKWIENPNAVAPGTIMAFAGIAAEADRRAIIEYLESQSGSPTSNSGSPKSNSGSPTPNSGSSTPNSGRAP